VVGERRGVEWVNDSKATNVDSTMVALQAFPAGSARVVLVLGGRGKGAPYAPLRSLFPGRVKALLTIGEDAPAVERELGDLAPTERAGTLEAAVVRAARLAGPGDVVLLSPACASYDQFRNYEERGEAFRRLVGELA
jgi:UDP-N-acetylmuramoylalanine--D-glutamate ligase